MSFNLQLEGRSAVVTAASKGIGRVLVQALSDAGIRIAGPFDGGIASATQTFTIQRHSNGC